MRKLFLLIVASAIGIAAHAQTSGGLKAGLNLSTFGGDVDEGSDRSFRPGFHIGGYLNIGFNEKLSFQPELLFSTAGTKSEDNGDGYSYESTDKLSYLSIPLSLQYSFGKFSVHAGPQLSFLMSAKHEYTLSEVDGGDTVSESGEVDTKEYVKGVDFGLNIGAGLNFGKFGVNARYSLGLSNISEEGEEEDFKTTNSIIQLAVLYKLFGK